MGNLSAKTGFTPIQIQVTLANNAATSVQDFAAYDAQELTGFVYADGTSDYRAAVKVVVLKDGSGTYQIASADVSGDDVSSAALVSFSMSGSILQATLASITGYVTAYIKYNLNAPVLGTAGYFTNPMTITGDTVYGGASGLVTRLAGNTTTTKKFLTQTGDGTNSAAPAWNTIAAGDLPLADSSSNAGAVNPYAGTGVVYAGRWTPTVAYGSGTTSATTYSCHYIRVGNEVTCHGRIDVTTNVGSNTLCNIDISLPVVPASNFSATIECEGVVTRENGAGAQYSSGSVFANGSGAKTVQFDFASAGAASRAMYFSFTYALN